MKQLALIAAILGAGIVVSPIVQTAFAGGGTPAAATTGAVGVIDIESTLYDTPAGKRASEKFEKTRLAKQADLDKQQKDLQKAAADLEKQASVLKPDVLKSKRDELEKKFVALQQYYVKLERDLASDRATLIQDLLKSAQPNIAKIAKAEGVTLVVDRSSVLWSEDKVDLTAKLNALMK